MRSESMSIPVRPSGWPAPAPRSRCGPRAARSSTVLTAALLLLAQCATARAGSEIHVAINGKDENGGSAAAPVASLRQAQALARKAGGATVVVVHEGTWFLPEPLVFTSADSGCTWRAADGAKPILSGGRTIG